MKHSKLIRAAALIMLLCMALPALASCNSFSNTEYAVVSEGIISADGFIYDKYENSTVRITGIENMPLLLKIPAEIDGMPVVELYESAFADDGTLLYLELPTDTNIKLGKRVFSGCTSLVTVNFAGSVSSIPLGAFEDCRNLTTIEGLSAVTEIADQAFASCSALAYIKIPGGLASLGAEAFRGCTSLSSVTLPETLTYLGESAFWGCESLAKAEVNGSCELPKYAFLNCTMLADITIGDKVTAIGEEAFRGCISLYSVKIGKGVTNIGSYAFHACDALTETVFSGKRENITIGEGNEALGS